MGVFFIQFGMKSVEFLPTELVGKQYQVLRGVFIGQGNITRCIIDSKTAVVEVIVPIGERQRVLLGYLPLQS